MANITVNPNDNVQSKINSSASGDTITFNGVINISSTITLQSNRTYTGGTLNGAPGVNILYGGNSTIDNIRIHDLTLNVGHSATGIQVLHGITNSVFEKLVINIPGNALGVYNWISAPPDSSKADPAAWNAACPAAWKKWTIQDCDFVGNLNGYVDQNEAIHVRADTPAPPGPDNGPGKSVDFIFRRNRMRGIARTGLEEQGGGSNTIIEDNVFILPSLSNSAQVNGGSMAYSTADDASEGKLVQRNFIDAMQRPDGVGVTTGIEFAGHNGKCIDNYIHGTNASIVVQTGSNGIVTGNKIVNALHLPAVGGGHPNLTMNNNGPNVVLTWDINRSWPIGSVPTPPVPVPNQSPDNTICPPSQIIDASGVTWGLVNGSVSKNGLVDQTTFGIKFLLWLGSKLYQSTSSGFYRLDGINWILCADPRPTSSPDNTVCPPTPIVDSTGVVWALVNGSVAKNGVVDPATFNVNYLLWLGSKLYQSTTTGFYELDGASWIACPDPRPAPVVLVKTVVVTTTTKYLSDGTSTVSSTTTITP